MVFHGGLVGAQLHCLSVLCNTQVCDTTAAQGGTDGVNAVAHEAEDEGNVPRDEGFDQEVGRVERRIGRAPAAGLRPVPSGRSCYPIQCRRQWGRSRRDIRRRQLLDRRLPPTA
jgi:hypothetical protein